VSNTHEKTRAKHGHMMAIIRTAAAARAADHSRSTQRCDVSGRGCWGGRRVTDARCSRCLLLKIKTNRTVSHFKK
jgi:hypothetical protein